MLGINFVAATPMLGYLVAGLLILVIGVALLRLLQQHNAKPNQGFNWAPSIAFVCGPVLASVYFVADVLWFGTGTYTISSDYLDTYWRALMLGLVTGTLGFVAFWLDAKFKRQHGK